jgi:hypothetical protein
MQKWVGFLLCLIESTMNKIASGRNSHNRRHAYKLKKEDLKKSILLNFLLETKTANFNHNKINNRQSKY